MNASHTAVYTLTQTKDCLEYCTVSVLSCTVCIIQYKVHYHYWALSSTHVLDRISRSTFAVRNLDHCTLRCLILVRIDEKYKAWNHVESSRTQMWLLCDAREALVAALSPTMKYSDNTF